NTAQYPAGSLVHTSAASACAAVSGGIVGTNDPAIRLWWWNSDGHKGSGGGGADTLVADIETISYSADSVYIACEGIPAYQICPCQAGWHVAGQDWLYHFPRNPTMNLGPLTPTSLRQIGACVNGVPLFDARDGHSYSSAWHNNAVVVEADDFDACLGHP